MTVSEMYATGRAPQGGGPAPVVVTAGSGSCGLNASGGPSTPGVQIDPSQVVKSICGYTEFCIQNNNPAPMWLLLGGMQSQVVGGVFGSKLPISTDQIANNSPAVISCDAWIPPGAGAQVSSVRLFNDIAIAGITSRITYRIVSGTTTDLIKGTEAYQVSLDAFGNFKNDVVTFEFDPCDPCFSDGSNVANLSGTFVASRSTFALLPIPAPAEGQLSAKVKVRVCWDSVSRNENFSDCGI